MRIILASSSPRRKELLEKIVKDFEVIPSGINEEKIKSKEIDKLVEKVAYAKAEDVFIKEQDKDEDLIVISSDTMVCIDDKFMGKPKNKEEAKAMLSELSGKSNEIYTGLTLIIKEKNKITKEVINSKTLVEMKDMNDSDIEEYVSTGEPLDKAGAYAVQGKGSKYIKKIEGNYDSAVGLNTDLIKEFLKKYNVEVL